MKLLCQTTVMINQQPALLEEDRVGGTATCDCNDTQKMKSTYRLKKKNESRLFTYMRSKKILRVKLNQWNRCWFPNRDWFTEMFTTSCKWCFYIQEKPMLQLHGVIWTLLTNEFYGTKTFQINILTCAHTLWKWQWMSPKHLYSWQAGHYRRDPENLTFLHSVLYDWLLQGK